MDINWFHSLVGFINEVGSGYDITLVLIVLAVIDTGTGTFASYKMDKPLFSEHFNKGILMNFGASLMPAVITTLKYASRSVADIYDLAAFVIGCGIMLSLSQSIIANLINSGLSLPDWLAHLIGKYIYPEADRKQKRK